MRIQTKRRMWLSAVLFSVALVPSSGTFKPVTAQDQIERAKDRAVFKIPDGYMRAPLTDFRGMFVLDPKKAAGMFVTYGNDNEATEALRQRILTAITPMFIHDSNGKFETSAGSWAVQPLPSHPGDGAGTAATHVYIGTDREVQVAIYERNGGLRPFVYGYFAMRHKDRHGDDGKFLDANGNGVKAFDKLWKSFQK